MRDVCECDELYRIWDVCVSGGIGIEFFWGRAAKLRAGRLESPPAMEVIDLSVGDFALAAGGWGGECDHGRWGCACRDA